MDLDLDVIRKSVTSFSYFCEKILGYELTKFHNDVINETISKRYDVVIIPRGHSKTTIFSVCYPLWKLWTEGNIEICQVSNTLEQSKKTLGIVREIMSTNIYLKELLPQNKDKTWSKTEISTSQGGSYSVKPFSDSARGGHYDLVVMDDLLRDTDMTHEQIKEIFWSVFFPAVQTKGGQLIVVGTPMAHNDLLTELENNIDWGHLRLSAINLDDKGNWISPLWEEKFSLKELENIKNAMGSFRFNREYMCDPQASGSRLIDQTKLLNCLDDNLGFSSEANGQVYIGCDFALSGAVHGDYSVFTVVEVGTEPYLKKVKIDGKQREITIENPVIIKKVDRFRGMPVELQESKIKALVDTYEGKTSKVIVDSSTFGEIFLQDLRQMTLPVEGQNFAQAARNSLLVNMKKIIESGRLVIPFAQDDSFAYSTMKRYIEEISSMTEMSTRTDSTGKTLKSSMKHDDCVMSLALALKYCVPKRMSTDQVVFTL